MIGTSDGEQFKDSMAATMALGATEKPAGAFIEEARYPGSPKPLGPPQVQPRFTEDELEMQRKGEEMSQQQQAPKVPGAMSMEELRTYLFGRKGLDSVDPKGTFNDEPTEGQKLRNILGGFQSEDNSKGAIDPDRLLEDKGLNMSKSDMGMSRGDHQGDRIDQYPGFGNPTATKQDINLDPKIMSVLSQPHIAEAIANPKIDRSHDVPYEAGASNKPGDYTTHIDKSIPSEVTISGKTFDPAIPANIHEQVEREVMNNLIKIGMSNEKAYEIAHHEYAEPAENAWYEHHGIDVKEVDKWWAKQDKTTEKETSDDKDFPKDLYKKPYAHSKVEGSKHEPSDVNQVWAMNKDLPANDNLPEHNPMRKMDEISQLLRELQNLQAGGGKVIPISPK